jgi:hypothetical protein
MTTGIFFIGVDYVLLKCTRRTRVVNYGCDCDCDIAGLSTFGSDPDEHFVNVLEK